MASQEALMRAVVFETWVGFLFAATRVAATVRNYIVVVLRLFVFTTEAVVYGRDLPKRCLTSGTPPCLLLRVILRRLRGRPHFDAFHVKDIIAVLTTPYLFADTDLIATNHAFKLSFS